MMAASLIGMFSLIIEAVGDPDPNVPMRDPASGIHQDMKRMLMVIGRRADFAQFCGELSVVQGGES